MRARQIVVLIYWLALCSIVGAGVVSIIPTLFHRSPKVAALKTPECRDRANKLYRELRAIASAYVAAGAGRDPRRIFQASLERWDKAMSSLWSDCPRSSVRLLRRLERIRYRTDRVLTRYQKELSRVTTEMERELGGQRSARAPSDRPP